MESTKQIGEPTAVGNPAALARPHDGRLWEELQRAFHRLVRHEGREHADDDIAVELEVGERRYFVRTVAIADKRVPGKVILVAVELRNASEPSIEDIQAAFDLTPREAEVALLLAERLTGKEIARRLGVTLHTARRHTEKVLRKLGISRRTDVRWLLLERATDLQTAIASTPGAG